MSGELTLAQAFEQAAAASQAGDSGAALSLVARCEALVSAAALFSANEDGEDLLTGSMRYLLLPAMRARLLADVQPGEPAEQRVRRLQEAAACYSQFLQAAAQYGLLSGPSLAAYAAEEAGQALDAGQARMAKVARFKRGRALAAALAQLNARRGAAGEAGTEAGAGGWDEQDERSLWALQLEAAALEALDARPLLAQEVQLLSHAAEAQQAAPASCGSSSSSSRVPPAPRAGQQRAQQEQMLASLSDIAGQLGGDRQALRAQVLRPGHRLPSMTVEQAGAIECAQARAQQAAQAKAAARRAAAAAAARSDDEDDAGLAAARAADDWLDDNPAGWGNSKLRPCS